MYARIFLLLSMLVFATNSLSLSAEEQNLKLSDWKVYSSYSDVNSLVKDKNGRLWCGANGGITIVNTNNPNSELKYLGAETGLINLEITTLAYSEVHNVVIAGSYDGTIQIIDSNLKSEAIYDIKRTNFANTVITDIVCSGDLVYISGGFGIGVYNLRKNIFTETITKIANYDRYTTVHKVLIDDDNIYAATQKGIAKAPLSSLIQNPQSWRILPIVDSIKTPIAINLLKIKDDLIAVVDTNKLLKLENDTFKVIASYPNYSIINSIINIHDSLYIADQFGIAKINSDRLPINHPLIQGNNTSIARAIVLEQAPNLRLGIAYKENGVGISDNNEVFLPKFNSALKRVYYESDMDKFGNLWLASGQASEARGFTVLTSGGKWINANSLNTPFITNNAFYNVYSAPNGRTYLGNWGNGLCEVELINDTLNIINIYNTDNSPLTGYKGDPNDKYTLASGAKLLNNELYFINTLAMPGMPLLIKRNANDEFSTVSLPNYITSTYFQNLEIDNFRTKWLASTNGGGLAYINEEKDIYGLIQTSGTNLISNAINSIVFDQQGYLWIGTDKGLNMLINSSSVLGSTSPIIRKINALSGNIVNDIYIDAIDNKWIATENGVFVISPDGATLLAEYNIKNSLLTSNSIKSITSNPIDGRVYFCTAGGIYSALSLSVNPEPTYSIECYPQPFNPRDDAELIINGLAKDNTLKIVTLEGRFIRSINALGGRAIWDGKDDKGNIVESGVYLILASSTAGAEASVGKIVIKNK